MTPAHLALSARWMGAVALLAGSAAMAQTPPVAAPAPEAAAPAAVFGDARQGTFKTVQGEVTVVRGNVRSAAVVGSPLMAADRVLTGAKSAAAVTLKDGTVLPEVAVEYPIGHKRRRTDGIPLLEAKFRTNLARRFPAKQQQAILGISLDQKLLETMPVHEYVDLYVI